MKVLIDRRMSRSIIRSLKNIFLSGLLVYKSLEFYDKNRYFSLDLPNSWNFAFNFGLFLRIYLFVMPLGEFSLRKAQRQNSSIDMKIFFFFSTVAHDEIYVNSTQKDIEEKE